MKTLVLPLVGLQRFVLLGFTLVQVRRLRRQHPLFPLYHKAAVIELRDVLELLYSWIRQPESWISVLLFVAVFRRAFIFLNFDHILMGLFQSDVDYLLADVVLGQSREVLGLL